MANLKKNNDMAVSPIVATLVLIVVAVIGAVAVGTIMGTFSSDVSKQANRRSGRIRIPDRDPHRRFDHAHPGRANLQIDYQRANPGIQINVQGGGSS